MPDPIINPEIINPSTVENIIKLVSNTSEKEPGGMKLGVTSNDLNPTSLADIITRAILTPSVYKILTEPIRDLFSLQRALANHIIHLSSIKVSTDFDVDLRISVYQALLAYSDTLFAKIHYFSPVESVIEISDLIRRITDEDIDEEAVIKLGEELARNTNVNAQTILDFLAFYTAMNRPEEVSDNADNN